MTGDLRVTVIVKNGRMLHAMERAGFQSAAALSRACGVSQSDIGHYLALKLPPYRADGSLRPSILMIGGALNVLPEELFPETFLYRSLATNRVTRDVPAADIPALTGDHESVALSYDPERAAIIEEAVSELTSVLGTLLPREREFISMYYGLGGQPRLTLEQIASNAGITRERIRQIILKGERKMRHPARNLRARCAGLLDAPL